MKRIRTLGLGAAMALALLAFPAGASAAGGIEAAQYPATLKAANTGGQHNLQLPGYAWNSCNTEFQTQIEHATHTIKASPVWNSCIFAPIKANGCKFEFHPGTENSFDIGPPGCGPITFEQHSGGQWLCKVKIGAQTGVPATYANMGTGSNAYVRIATNAALKATVEGAFCNNKATSVSYQGEWDMHGFNAVGEKTGIHTTDEGDLGVGGLYIAGEGSEEEASQPRFEAEKYPRPITGDFNPSQPLFILEGSGLSMYCGVEVSANATAPSANLALDPEYTECWDDTGGTLTVDMNSCHFELSVDNSGPAYTGDMGLVCGKEGDVMVLYDNPPIVGTCTISMPPQSLATVEYENVGEGSGRYVVAHLEGSENTGTYKEGGFGCFGFSGLREDIGIGPSDITLKGIE